jgi:hypothetical protein
MSDNVRPAGRARVAERPGSSVGAAVGRVLLLSVALFVAAFATHEVMHLLVLYSVGGQGSLVVRPWRLSLIDGSIWAVHVQPDQPVGTVRQALVNFLGPSLAAVPLALLLTQVREPVVRIAIAANIVVLAFYAIIETADYLAETIYDVDFPILTTPEFNYGVPLLVFLAAAYAIALGWRSHH